MNIELTRRTLCMASWVYTLNATCLGAVRWFGSFARAATPEFPPDRQAIEAWMDKWMKRDRESIGALHIGRFADPMYFLLKPITWKPNPGQEAFQAVSVPEGFVTDFASIPRIFWSALRPDGLYTYPAIVHDYLYWEQNVPKDVADSVL